MKRELGIAYCGLACCLCSEQESCPGCRSDGCQDKDFCRNLRCCKAHGYEGCWACRSFPCTGTILDKPRIRAFARFAGTYGTETLLDALEEGERRGLRYHDSGELVGDYDRPGDEAAVFALLLELAGGGPCATRQGGNET